MLSRLLRWLLTPPQVTRPYPESGPLCPVRGCFTRLRRDYDLCAYHAGLIPPPIARALARAGAKHTPEHRAALNAAIAAVERQLQPPS